MMLLHWLLAIGDEITTDTGTVRIISPTDCVKDRLSWFYHSKDTQCLEQAVLVAAANPVDILEIERWSKAEGMSHLLNQIRHRLVSSRRRGSER